LTATLISILKTLLQVSTETISMFDEVISFVSPAQLAEDWVAIIPVVDGIVTCFPVVKDNLPEVAGEAFPEVSGLAVAVVNDLAEVVSDLTDVVSVLETELNP